MRAGHGGVTNAGRRTSLQALYVCVTLCRTCAVCCVICFGCGGRPVCKSCVREATMWAATAADAMATMLSARVGLGWVGAGAGTSDEDLLLTSVPRDEDWGMPRNHLRHLDPTRTRGLATPRETATAVRQLAGLRRRRWQALPDRGPRATAALLPGRACAPSAF